MDIIAIVGEKRELYLEEAQFVNVSRALAIHMIVQEKPNQQSVSCNIGVTISI